jgi:hypothetical protein
MPRLVPIEDDEENRDEPGEVEIKPRRLEIEDDDEPGENEMEEVRPHQARRIEIEDDDDERSETERADTPAPDDLPILWRRDLQLWTIADTNVVFSPEICMVIGFVYRSVLIRAPTKEVKQVCDAYKVIYLDPEKYFI